ncbi:MAG: UbiX family flavin prenyltransferase [Thermoguttaceae bacterium]
MKSHSIDQPIRRIIVGISGASGSLYAVSLLRELEQYPVEVHAVCSKMGKVVLQHECGCDETAFPGVIWYDVDDLFARIASGSAQINDMVVVPCSLNTLACLANGIAGNLLQRAGAVMLKEGRRLILVPRETPIEAIALENMLKLVQSGATVLPASPGFYHHPQSMDDLVRFITGKILDQLGLEHDLVPKWGAETE